jgi:hypothetical protein
LAITVKNRNSCAELAPYRTPQDRHPVRKIDSFWHRRCY